MVAPMACAQARPTDASAAVTTGQCAVAGSGRNRLDRAGAYGGAYGREQRRAKATIAAQERRQAGRYLRCKGIRRRLRARQAPDDNVLFANL